MAGFSEPRCVRLNVRFPPIPAISGMAAFDPLRTLKELNGTGVLPARQQSANEAHQVRNRDCRDLRTYVLKMAILRAGVADIGQWRRNEDAIESLFSGCCLPRIDAGG